MSVVWKWLSMWKKMLLLNWRSQLALIWVILSLVCPRLMYEHELLPRTMSPDKAGHQSWWRKKVRRAKTWCQAELQRWAHFVPIQLPVSFLSLSVLLMAYEFPGSLVSTQHSNPFLAAVVKLTSSLSSIVGLFQLSYFHTCTHTPPSSVFWYINHIKSTGPLS